jgi:hypothetical protein
MMLCSRLSYCDDYFYKRVNYYIIGNTTNHQGTMQSNNNNNNNNNKCGLTKIIIFLLALFFATGASITAKIIMSMPVTIHTHEDSSSGGGGGGDNDDESTTRSFQKPLFLTFSMFVSMLLGLLLHWIVVVFHIPFPGYDFDGISNNISEVDCASIEQEVVSLVDPSFTSDSIVSIRRDDDYNKSGKEGRRNVVPMWMYFYLSIPAIFDFAATVFG